LLSEVFKVTLAEVMMLEVAE
jgi:hypothetical protein